VKVHRGFTLIELLIVVAVIALLAAVVLSAMQSVVASAHRVSCKSNLRQLGDAIHAYHASVGCFPVTFVDRNEFAAGECGTGFYSWRAYLLPYIEQSALYEQINFDQPMSDSCGATGVFGAAHANATAARATVALFLCPADGAAAETVLPAAAPANDNYAANFGWPPQSTGVLPTRAATRTNPYNGVLGIATGNPRNQPAWHPNRPLTDRDVEDGLQHTAMVAERLIFSIDHLRDPDRLVYCGGSPGPRTQERLVRYCNLVDVPDKIYSSMIGQAWISGFAPFGPGYMHLMPPNGRSCHDAGGELQANWWSSASSNHPGGVHVLLADGHVAWVDNGVDREIWWALGSRDGQEVNRPLMH
jgi:prepilin-type N-terminal cleavage/methylation domain-containing protein/prepilin-type processing-associated H-X9-DG protein